MADKKRRYNVWETKNSHGQLLLYFVTDRINKDEDEEGYRTVAEFPIGPRHDEDEQARRAVDYCAYMNKLLEAAEQAYEHNKLVNILKS